MFSSETDIGQNEKPIYNLERIELSDDPITLRTRYLQPSPRFSFAIGKMFYLTWNVFFYNWLDEPGVPGCVCVCEGVCLDVNIRRTEAS